MDDRTFDDLARALGSGRSRRGLLKAIGGAALGMVGASATSRGVFANAGKVGICHVDGQGRFRHISVNANAVSAHLAHGDYLADIANDPDNCGACGNVCEDADACTTSSCVDGVCEYTYVPVDCAVSEWSEWSACSAECGGGTQVRTRTVTTEASCGGVACPALEQSQGLQHGGVR
jgi:hypothetical protein